MAKANRFQALLCSRGILLALLLVANVPGEAAAHDPSLQALAGYNAQLEEDPNNVEALRARGSSFRALELYDDALNDLEKAESLAPGHPEVRSEIGICRYMLGESDEALKILLEADTLLKEKIESKEWGEEQYGPVERELRETLLSIFREKGEIEKALEQCMLLERYMGGKLAFLCDRADLLLEMGKTREALVLYEETVANNPAFERFCVGAANCYLHLGEVDMAEEIFVKWSDDDPEAALPHMFHALILDKWKNEPGAAAEAMDEALRIIGSRVDGIEMPELEDVVIKARIVQANGDHAASAELLDDIMEYFRGHYLVVHMQSINCRALGRIEEADSFERESRLYRRLNPKDWLRAYSLVMPQPTAREEIVEAVAESVDEEEESAGVGVGIAVAAAGILAIVLLAVVAMRRYNTKV